MCPQCKSKLIVPEVQPASPEPLKPEPLPSSYQFEQEPPETDSTWSVNPYEASVSEEYPHQAKYDPPPPTGPVTLDIGYVFTRSWELVSDQLGLVLGVGAVGVAVFLATSAALTIFEQLTIAIAESMSDELGTLVSLAFIFFGVVATNLTHALVFCGVLRVYLRIARGKRAEFGDIYGVVDRLIPITLATFIYSLATFVGSIVCCIPGIIIALMFSQYLFLIIDRNRGAMDSLTSSADLVYGNKLVVWVLSVLMGMMEVCAFLTCIGYFFVVPYTLMMRTVIYTQLTKTGNYGPPTQDW